MWKEILRYNKAKALAERGDRIVWAKRLTGERTWNVLKQVLGEEGAATASAVLRRLPIIGEHFGIAGKRMNLLGRVAEAIHHLDGGRPVFGTVEILGEGKGATREIRWLQREGEANWRKLKPEEKHAVLTWVRERDAHMKVYNIVSRQEGYLRRIGQKIKSLEESAGTFMGEVKAGERRTRLGTADVLEREARGDLDFEGAVSGYKAALEKERLWNEHAEKLAEIAGRDWDKNTPLPEGWVRIPHQIGGSEARVFGAGKIVPKPFYDRWVEVRGLGAAMHPVVRGLGAVINVAKTIILSAGKTLFRNVLGGALQHTIGAIENTFDGLMSGSLRKGMAWAKAPLKALMPSSWDALPPGVLGAGSREQVGGVAGRIGRMQNAAMTFYSKVENFWKRAAAIAHLEGEGLEASIRGLMDDAANARMRDTLDAFTFDYQNLAPHMNTLLKHPGMSLFSLFPVYPYKSARLLTRYLAAFNPLARMPLRARIARMLTFGTVVTIGALANMKAKQRGLRSVKGDRDRDLSGHLPLGVRDSVGEWMVDSKEQDTLGWLQALGSGDPNRLADIGINGIGAPGPLVQAAFIGLGDPERRGARFGAMLGTMSMPFGREARDYRKQLRAEQGLEERDAKNFMEAFGEFVPAPIGNRKTGASHGVQDEFTMRTNRLGLPIKRVNRIEQRRAWWRDAQKRLKAAKTPKEIGEVVREIEEFRSEALPR